MKLDDWLRQDHSPGERLRVVEKLSQAVNEVHDRGETLPALAPATVEVDSDGGCDVKAARRGAASAPYRAPERESGDPSSAEADIYAAGAIAWEVLAGRPCGDSPPHLAEARPGLPREVADAVMGCLERSPVWRPKDLAYLAQVAAAHQTSGRSQQPAAARPGPARPAARSSAGAARPQARASQHRPSRSHVPLVFVGLIVVAAAAGSYFWLTRSSSGTSSAAAVPPPPSAAVTPAGPGSEQTPAPGGEANPAPDSSMPTPAPTPAAALATPPPVAAAAAPVAPVATPIATPPPLPAATPVPTPTPAPVRPAPTPTPAPAPTPTPAPAAARPAAAVPAPAQPPAQAAPPAPPAVLSTVSPLTIQRASKQALVDLRGSGLRSDHRVRVVALRDAPRGIRVVRQKWVDAGLITALIELDANASTGTFGITVVDAAGQQAPPLTLTVAK